MNYSFEFLTNFSLQPFRPLFGGSAACAIITRDGYVRRSVYRHPLPQLQSGVCEFTHSSVSLTSRSTPRVTWFCINCKAGIRIEAHEFRQHLDDVRKELEEFEREATRESRPIEQRPRKGDSPDLNFGGAPGLCRHGSAFRPPGVEYRRARAAKGVEVVLRSLTCGRSGPR